MGQCSGAAVGGKLTPRRGYRRVLARTHSRDPLSYRVPEIRTWFDRTAEPQNHAPRACNPVYTSGTLY